MRRGVKKVPQVMQMEALECGAACLTMILAYYGRWVPLEKMRTECGVSRDGSKASNIVKAARNYGLDAKGYTYSIKALREVEPPCILFWNFNHFVVYRGMTKKYAYLNDPARGEIRVPMEEFDRSFTGIALLFEPTERFETGGRPPSTALFVRERLKGLGAPLAFVCLAAALISIIGIVGVAFSQVFVDTILPSESPGAVRLIVGIMLLLAVAMGIVQALLAIYMMRIQGKTAVVASSRFMRHLLHLPSGFYEQRMVGDLQQRQMANETVIATLVGQLAPILINAIMLVLYLVVMVRYSITLTVMGVAAVLINVFMARYISHKRVNLTRKLASGEGKFYSTTVAGIEAIETIKASGAEAGYFQQWSGFQAGVNEGTAQTIALNEYLGNVPTLVVELANVAVLVFGMWLITRNAFSAGSLVAFQGLLSSFMVPITQIVSLGQMIREMETQMERIEDVMRYQVDVPEESLAVELEATKEFGTQKLRGGLDLKGVTFGYSPLEPPLIENFDLHVDPGEWVALVGASGSGKSTIAKLVSGLYQPWSGSVEFGGTPLEDVPRPVLRSSLSVVDQDIVVFDDTVAENLRMWDGSIEDFEVILACRDAQIHDEIMLRDRGYDSRVMPGGRNYSGGQLQRMEIARALASDPSIIILDEATSALDAKTESVVIDQIRARGITCIVVAHRISTIRDCDEIVVLERGKVVERGKHEQLMRENGAYARLVRSD